MKNSRTSPAGAMPALQKYFSDTEIAAALGIGRRTVHRWVDEGILPAPVHFGRTIRWAAADLATAIDKLRGHRERKAGRPTRREEQQAREAGFADVKSYRAAQKGGATC